jgi:hypothetical protein
MDKRMVVEVDEKDVRVFQKYDLIFRSINLALLEMGIGDLKFKRLPDEDGKIKIEIDHEPKHTELVDLKIENEKLRSQQCDAYNMNGLPCEHMNKLVKALDKKHFDGEIQDLLK